MISFDEFKAEWLGKSVDYDHTFGKQCVDLIRQGFYEMYNLPGGGGVPSAITYWQATPDEVLQKFIRIPNSDGQKGDVVILWGLPGNADGHIGWATGNKTAATIEILEQNGSTGNGSGTGGDAIRTRYVDRSRVAGLLRPIAVIAPPAPVEKFQVTETYPQGRQIRLNKQPTNLWGMNYADPGALAPIEVHNAGEVWTVTNKIHHVNGYDYYRRDGQVDGFNVLDCDDYVAPPPPVPAAPQVIATPNIPLQLAEKYQVITKLMVFPSSTDAKALSNYTGTDLEPGSYYVFAHDNNAYNLSTSNVQNQNKWVRITDNVIKPVEVLQPTLPVDAPPTDITLPVDPPTPPVIADVLPTATHPKPQYYWIRDDRLPVRLTSTNTTAVKIADLEGKWPVQDFPARHTEDYSMFTVINGSEYWLPDKTRQKGYMYGLSVAFLPDEEPIKPTAFDRNANGRYDIIDIFDNGIQGFIETSSKYLDGIKAAVTTIAPKIEPVKQRVVKTIDGISRRKL